MSEEHPKPPEADAEAPEADAEAPEVDAEAPEADAEAPEADAEAPEADAEAPEADAEAPEADAEVPEAEGEPSPAPVSTPRPAIDLTALPPKYSEPASLSGPTMGNLLTLIGLLSCIAGVGLGVWYFHLSGRLLIVWPDLAEEISIADAVTEPHRHRGWVAVHGRLWRVRERRSRALLVSARHGNELRSAVEVQKLARRGAHLGKSALEVSRKPLPSLRLPVALPRGKLTATLAATLTGGHEVTLLGKLQRPHRERGRWRLGVVAERQRPSASALITPMLNALMTLLFFAIGAVVIRAGVHVRRRRD